MVGALGVLGDEAEGLLGIHGGVGEVFEEKLAGSVVGAAEGGEQAALFEELERAEVDLLVAAHGVHEGLLVLCETRRIEDDEVVFRLGGFQEIEDVRLDDFDIELVQFGIFPCRSAGRGGDIHGGDLRRASFCAG